MSNPEEQQPQQAQPKGKVAQFFEKHGGLLAAAAGLVAAGITLYAVTRGGGGSSSGTGATSATGNGPGSAANGSGSGDTGSGSDTSGITSLLNTLNTNITTENNLLSRLLGNNPPASGGGKIPPPHPPVHPLPPVKPPPIVHPVPPVLSGGKRGRPVSPTEVPPVSTHIVPIKYFNKPAPEPVHQVGEHTGPPVKGKAGNAGVGPATRERVS